MQPDLGDLESVRNFVTVFKDKFLFKVLIPFFKRMAQDKAMGALPEIRAAVDPAVKGGSYYGPDRNKERKGYPSW